MMNKIEIFLEALEGWIWGTPLMILLVSVGLYLTYLLKGLQFRYLWYSLKLAFTKQDLDAPGDISNFQALMTALAATIGIGSITGVATAIAMGGLGSLFWMWIAGILGMATKYAEGILAVKYRIVDEKNEMCGGPMYYLARGLRSKRLAALFAIFGAIAALSTGNMVQANSISSGLKSLFHIDPMISGIVIALLTGIALFRGIKSIGKISSYFVPFMALLYITTGLIVIFLKIDLVPSVFKMIFQSAFTGQAATGGFVGSSILIAMQYGISRGIFSSEAGLGSAPIAAAAAKTDFPGRQAMISMSGVFITTFIVCTITGLAVGVTNLIGTYDAEGNLMNGSTLVLNAFESILPGGGFIVTLSLILFGYSTILGWAYYGEKCVEYLLGIKMVQWYRVLFTLVLIPGSVLSIQLVWSLANIMNGLMAFPNLIGILGLSQEVALDTVKFKRLIRREKILTTN